MTPADKKMAAAADRVLELNRLRAKNAELEERNAELVAALQATQTSSPCLTIHCRHYDLANGLICHIEAQKLARAALAKVQS